MTTAIEKLDGTAVGTLWLATKENGAVCALAFDHRWLAERGTLESHEGSLTPRGAPSAARKSIERYFAGELVALDEIAVEATGTPFQRKVWAALRAIPVGETRSYAKVAKAIGAPSAVRAVATANARNPVAIIVPCHRVIGSDGGLRGYGGGLPRKAWLLEHEAAGLSPTARQRALFDESLARQ